MPPLDHPTRLGKTLSAYRAKFARAAAAAAGVVSPRGASQDRRARQSGMAARKRMFRAYLLDNKSKTFLLEDGMTVEDLAHRMLTKLDISSVDEIVHVFGLRVCNEHGRLQRWVYEEETLEAVLREVGDKGQLVFMIRLFVDDLVRSADPMLLFLQYIQAVYMVVSGQYPVDEAVAIELAAIQFRQTFGRNVSAGAGFLQDRVVEFFPHRLLSARGGAELEVELLAATRALPDSLENASARVSYLEIAESWDFYGCAFYPSLQTTLPRVPESVVLGVSAAGLQVFSRDGSKRLLAFGIADLHSWGFVEGQSFFIEVEDPRRRSTTCRVDFQTKHGREAKRLLEDYAYEAMHHREENDEVFSRSIHLEESSPTDEEGGEDARSRAAPAREKAPAELIHRQPKHPGGASLVAVPETALLAVTRLQARWRGIRLRLGWERAAAMVLIRGVVSRYVRRFRERRRRHAVVIQSHFRGFRVRNDLYKVEQDMLAILAEAGAGDEEVAYVAWEAIVEEAAAAEGEEDAHTTAVEGDANVLDHDPVFAAA